MEENVSNSEWGSELDNVAMVGFQERGGLGRRRGRRGGMVKG